MKEIKLTRKGARLFHRMNETAQAYGREDTKKAFYAWGRALGALAKYIKALETK